jgi:molecular chaperone GrpE
MSAAEGDAPEPTPVGEAVAAAASADAAGGPGVSDGSATGTDPIDTALEEAAAVVEADIARIAAERDDYLDALRRMQADFENYKKQTIRRNTETLEHAARGLVEKLLPTLDAFESALAHGSEDVKPVYDVLMDALEREGLTVVYPLGEPFDPNTMEAVVHQAGVGGEGPTVSGVLRAGYLWKNRVLRPAMVQVEG